MGRHYRGKVGLPPKSNDIVNDDIRFSKVLLISETGEKLGILSIEEAKQYAYDKDLDIICVSENSKPPVCRVLDYSKYKFLKQKNEKEQKKNRTIIKVKEIQLRPAISLNDLNTKVKRAIGFLEDGNRVKVSLRFRGREMVRKELGFQVINKFGELIQDHGRIEGEINSAGRSLEAHIIPLKNKKN